jgi:hypothetical protein
MFSIIHTDRKLGYSGSWFWPFQGKEEPKDGEEIACTEERAKRWLGANEIAVAESSPANGNIKWAEHRGAKMRFCLASRSARELG